MDSEFLKELLDEKAETLNLLHIGIESELKGIMETTYHNLSSQLLTLLAKRIKMYATIIAEVERSLEYTNDKYVEALDEERQATEGK